MPTIKWLATAAIQGVVATLAVNPSVVSANPNVVSRNAIRAAVFVILAVAMVAARTAPVRTVRVMTAVADSAREMVVETATAVATVKSAVLVAIPIALAA